MAPRLGSPLNPYQNHLIVIALETAAQQTAIIALKKFMGVNLKEHEARWVSNTFNWKKSIPPKTKILTQIWIEEEFEKKHQVQKIWLPIYRPRRH